MGDGSSALVSADPAKRLLLVILTDLDELSKGKLVDTLTQSSRVNIAPETWTPSWQLLASVAKQGAHRDSQANIYAIAILAYRRGFEQFLIADDLSKRQLNRQTRWREDRKLSLVQVRVQRAPQELLVFAQRISVQNDDGTGKPLPIDEGENITKLSLPWMGLSSS